MKKETINNLAIKVKVPPNNVLCVVSPLYDNVIGCP
jgi:hypothetical protein